MLFNIVLRRPVSHCQAFSACSTHRKLHTEAILIYSSYGQRSFDPEENGNLAEQFSVVAALPVGTLRALRVRSFCRTLDAVPHLLCQFRGPA